MTVADSDTPALAPPSSKLLALRSEFSARVKARRAQLGLTQAEVAERASMERAVLAKIETGHSLPSLTVWLELSRALEVDPGPMLRDRKCWDCQDMPPSGFACLTCGTRRERFHV